jgi:hypothetical protein
MLLKHSFLQLFKGDIYFSIIEIGNTIRGFLITIRLLAAILIDFSERIRMQRPLASVS